MRALSFFFLGYPTDPTLQRFSDGKKQRLGVVFCCVWFLVGISLAQGVPSVVASTSCVARVSPTGTVPPSSDCSSSFCTWNQAIGYCALATVPGVSSWKFLLDDGTYVFGNAVFPTDLVVPPGVSDIRILRMYDSSKHVVWFGSASKMVIQSANTLTRCMVQGLVFAQNSTLSITLSGTENQVLIDSCTFTGSSGNRPLQIYSAGAIHLNNSIWSENKLTGGAEVRGNFGSVLIQDCHFLNNTVSHDSGGGLLIRGEYSRIHVENSTFLGNDAIGDVLPSGSKCRNADFGCGGGGVAVDATGNCSVLYSSFSFNTARRLSGQFGNSGGGGLWMRCRNIYVGHSFFFSNLASDNGMIGFGSNGGGGGWMLANDTLTVENVTGRNNQAILNGKNGPYKLSLPGSGGGTFWLQSLHNATTVTGGIFVSNTAFRNGIGVEDPVSSSSASNGGVSNGGGAIFIWTVKDLIRLEGGIFLNNSAVENGIGGNNTQYSSGNGGSFNGGGAVWMNSETSFCTVSNVTMRNNLSLKNGIGGSKNYLTGNGGFANGGGGLWIWSSSRIILQSCTFTRNVASEDGRGGDYNNIQSLGGDTNGGGAVFGWSYTRSWTNLSTDNFFVDNLAERCGKGGEFREDEQYIPLSSGGSFCGGGGAFLRNTAISRSVFIGNRAIDSGVGLSQSSFGSDGSNNGGGAIMSLSSLTSNCNFSLNVAKSNRLSACGNGGAIRLAINSNLTHSSFRNNSASYQGGAVASGSGKNQIEYSNFFDSSATFDGGALVLDVPNSNLVVSQTIFVRNRALSSKGGAIAISSFFSQVSSRSCSFSSNFAKSVGGAIAAMFEGSIYSSSQDIFERNTAESFGGAIFVGSGSSASNILDENVLPSTIHVRGGHFRSNRASFGGFLASMDDGVSEISSSIAIANQASRVSGGFAHIMSHSVLRINDSTLLENTALVSAGSFYNEHFSVLWLTNVSVSKSEAFSAGAVKSQHLARVYLLSNTTLFKNNGNLTYSGALYGDGFSNFYGKDTFFLENKARSYGGAISLSDSSSMYLIDSFIQRNNASTSGGGGLHISSRANFSSFNLKCFENSAIGGAGGCAFVSDSATIQLQKSRIQNNRALKGDGGGISYSSTARFLISQTQFFRNSAWRGGAISFNESSLWFRASQAMFLSLHDCRFLENRAFTPLDRIRNPSVGILAPGGGGALFFDFPSNLSLFYAFQVWNRWNNTNFFAENVANYGRDVASVGYSPFLVHSFSHRYLVACQNIASYRFQTLLNDSSIPSMPQSKVELLVGACDVFGSQVNTLEGGTIIYSWNGVDTGSSPDVLRTVTPNGTTLLETKIPEDSRPRSVLDLSIQVTGREFQNFPVLQLIWNTSACVPFFGYTENSGCTLCSPSEFSIVTNTRPCLSCNSLSEGAECISKKISSLKNKQYVDSVLPHEPEASATVIRILSGYWPALSGDPSSEVAPVTVIPLSCPFDFCSRGSEIFVTGVDQTQSLLTTSNSAEVCHPSSFRDPASPLCGKCLPGYADWNYDCYLCPNGPQLGYVFLFLLLMFLWTFVQLILAQQGGSGSVSAMLFFLTQSLSWFTYPLGILHTVENLVNFRFQVSSTDDCYIDVDGSVELFLRVLIPLSYFLMLWTIYLIHLSIAWCLSNRVRRNQDQTQQVSQGKFAKFWSQIQHLLVATASAEPYQRTTALLLLNTFTAILESVFNVWTCVHVPMGSSTVSVVALTPSVQCSTSTYWLWNIFYITVLIGSMVLIIFVVVATLRARKERVFSLHRFKSVSSISEEEFHYVPKFLSEKFGEIWKESFRDEVPWWTAVELFVRLLLIAIFSLSVIRARAYSNYIIGAAIVGWIIFHHIYSPYRDKVIDRLNVFSECAMLLMAMAASTNQVGSDIPIIIVFSVYGVAAGILGYYIIWKVVNFIRLKITSYQRKRSVSRFKSELSMELLRPVQSYMKRMTLPKE